MLELELLGDAEVRIHHGSRFVMAQRRIVAAIRAARNTSLLRRGS